MTEPPMSRNASPVMMGTSGMSAFRKMCFQTSERGGTPFARAVSMKFEFTVSNTAVRPIRISFPIDAEPRTMAAGAIFLMAR